MVFPCSVQNVRGNTTMTRLPWCTDYSQKPCDLSEGMLLFAQSTPHHSNHLKNLLQERECMYNEKWNVNPYWSHPGNFWSLNTPRNMLIGFNQLVSFFQNVKQKTENQRPTAKVLLFHFCFEVQFSCQYKPWHKQSFPVDMNSMPRSNLSRVKIQWGYFAQTLTTENLIVDHYKLDRSRDNKSDTFTTYKEHFKPGLDQTGEFLLPIL